METIRAKCLLWDQEDICRNKNDKRQLTEDEFETLRQEIEDLGFTTSDRPQYMFALEVTTPEDVEKVRQHVQKYADTTIWVYHWFASVFGDNDMITISKH